MSQTIRRFVSLAFAVLVAAGALGASPAPAAAADLTVSQAESEMVRLLNAERARAGLVAVRVDSRLVSIARQRSADMTNRNYFSHTQPDGRNVFDYINSAGIRWYAAAEIIAWNTWSTLADSARAARDGWMGSSGHRSIVMSNTYNYFGIGLSVDTDGRKVWTGVFIKGPDRTGGWTKLRPLSVGSRTSYGYRIATVSWTGGDMRLVALTAGFRHHQVQVRRDGGSWRWVTTATTAKSKRIRLWRGHVYDMRIRTCDKAGNCGAWTTQHMVG